MCSNFNTGFEYVTNIQNNISHYSDILKVENKSMQMPTIQEIVDDDTIGYFGEFPAPMIYNNFKYIPSPSTISFVGWNKWIINKDVNFYKNRNKPDYLLLHLYNDTSSIAEQFVITDSARAQLEIMNRYDPVILNQIPLQENDRLLLKRRKINMHKISVKNIDLKNGLLNEWIDVPKSASIIQAKIKLVDEPGFIQLVSLAYKAPLYSIEFVLDNGVVMEKRFVPNKAAEGFLVSPFIYNNENYLAAISEKYWRNYISNKSSNREKSILRRIEKFKIKCLAVMPIGKDGKRLDTHTGKYGCATSLSTEYYKVNGLEFGRLNYQIPMMHENDILGKWIINNNETCIFKKNNILYFLNEYKEQAMAFINGNDIWIKKWNVRARLAQNKTVIKFNNNTKWRRLNISEKHCYKN